MQEGPTVRDIVVLEQILYGIANAQMLASFSVDLPTLLPPYLDRGKNRQFITLCISRWFNGVYFGEQPMIDMLTDFLICSSKLLDDKAMEKPYYDFLLEIWNKYQSNNNYQRLVEQQCRLVKEESKQ